MDAVIWLGLLSLGLCVWCLRLMREVEKLNHAGYLITKKFVDVIEGKAVATLDKQNFRILVKYHDEEGKDGET